MLRQITILLLCVLPWASSQELKCAAKCKKNKQSWINKCVWKDLCSGCPECPEIRKCAKFCPVREQTWATKCQWSTCNGCPKCPKPITKCKATSCSPSCAQSSQPWDKKCAFHDCCACSKCREKSCNKDTDCDNGSYCSSKKKCVKFGQDYCERNVCGLGDGDCDSDDDDNKGCMPGLICGEANCAKYHEIGFRTGMQTSTGCCEEPITKCKATSCSPSCAQKSQPWNKKCAFHDCCACSKCQEKSCNKDTDCDNGSYCSSKKKCVKFGQDYCERNVCGLGDGDCDPDDDDNKGCMPGLICGEANCAKYHEIGFRTGMQTSTDCCEALPKCDPALCRPWCATRQLSITWREKCTWKDCCACSQCPGNPGIITPRPVRCTTTECKAFCAIRKQPWSEKCSWKDCCACSQCPGGFARPTGKPSSGKSCNKDSNCDNGSYCSSKKKCVKFGQDYCEGTVCGLGDGDCDPDDNKGCSKGLTCGVNNCNKYHDVGFGTGMTSSTDCCEGAVCTSTECKPFCVTKKQQPWSEKCTWKDCCACSQCFAAQARGMLATSGTPPNGGRTVYNITRSSTSSKSVAEADSTETCFLLDKIIVATLTGWLMRTFD